MGTGGIYIPVLPNGLSSILWAQYNRIPSPPFLISGSNDWTWDTAYQYFLAGLTGSDNATRNQNLAGLFTTLGHLTHLVSDVSVPEHTRNDAHVLRNYESWCKEKLTKLSSIASGLEAFRSDFPPDPAIFTQSQGGGFGSGPLSPISNLWDSYVPAGFYSPNLGGNERLVGLAEYSNFNYLSGDTVFKVYQHPNRNEAFGFRLEPEPATDGKTDYMVYFQRVTSDNVWVPHLAAADLLYQEWSQLPPEQQNEVPAHLDDRCWEDYASNLVPRAVSYGTALVDYFFRGKIDVKPEGSALRLTNRSPSAISGTITVFYDDPSDRLRKPVEGLENGAVEIASGATISKSIVGLPPDSLDKQYTLVFTGNMENLNSSGQAANSDVLVAGKVFKWDGDESLFLVDPDGKYIVFDLAVKDSRYELIPASKTIQLTRDNVSFGQTIQSDPSFKNHFAALPVIPKDGIPQYGVKIYGYQDWYGNVYYLSHGSPYSYRPADFSKGSPNVLDYGALYDWMGTPQSGQPYATGRHNYTLDSEGKMVSHHNSIWKRRTPQWTDEYFFRYKIDSSDLLVGSWVDGSVLEPGLTPIASVGADKAIGTIISGVSNPNQCSGVCLNGRPVLLKMGDMTVGLTDNYDFSVSRTPDPISVGINETIDFNRYCAWAGEFPPPGYRHVYENGTKVDSESTSKIPSIQLLDYDILSSANDFVIIFTKKTNASEIATPYTVSGNIYGCNIYYINEERRSTNIESNEYLLSYQVKGVQNEVPLGKSDVIYNAITGLQQTLGIRISSVSTKISDHHIVYTYVKELPGNSDWTQWQSDPWLFNRRVVGVVNISDSRLPLGYRQEFEIDFSAWSFEPRWVAIGITR